MKFSQDQALILSPEEWLHYAQLGLIEGISPPAQRQLLDLEDWVEGELHDMELLP